MAVLVAAQCAQIGALQRSDLEHELGERWDGVVSLQEHGYGPGALESPFEELQDGIAHRTTVGIDEQTTCASAMPGHVDFDHAIER
jgi:hypothetical protein